MTIEELVGQLAALRQLVVALANVGEVEEYVFGAHQGLVLQCLDRAGEGGLSRAQVLQTAFADLEILLDLAERDQLPFSIELLAQLSDARDAGFTSRQLLTSQPTKPLAHFAKEPELRHSVFVDESGTPSFEETAQPVLSLVGILVENNQIPIFEAEVDALLNRYGLAASTEIHTKDCISGEGPFAALNPEHRYELLKEFIALGMKRATGVHYLSMMKVLVADDTRTRLKRLRLDPYTNLVIWFNLTLQSCVIGRVGFRRYRYFFDRTDNYAKAIRRAVRGLRGNDNDRLRLHSMAGEPTAVDSSEHRLIQLADAVGFFLTRYRQFEVTTFEAPTNLRKHEPKIREIYEIVRPNVMSFVAEGLHMLIDWKALEEWTPPPQPKGSPNRAPRPKS